MTRQREPESKLLAGYRAATSLRPQERARALRRLQARLEAGETALRHLDLPVPELPPPHIGSPRRRTLWKRVAGAGTLLVGVWWFGSDVARPASSAARTASVSAASAATDTQAGAESARFSQPTAAGSMQPVEAFGATGSSLAPFQFAPPAPSGAADIGHATPAAASDALETHAAPKAASRAALRAARSVVVSAPPAAAREPEHPTQSGRPTATSAVPERREQPLPAANLERETELMEQAQAALRRGDAQRALSLLAEHTWRFPAGHLAEARDVARILALCQAGHVTQARARARSYLATHSSSPFAARVRASCPELPAREGHETQPEAR